MKKTLLLNILLLISIVGYAQQTAEEVRRKTVDSVKISYLRKAAFKYPTLRQASISSEIISRTNINSRLFGNELFDGRAQIYRTRANLIIPVTQWGKSAIVMSVGIIHQKIDLTHVKNADGKNPGTNQTIFRTTFATGGSLTRTDSIFNRSFTINAGASVFSNQSFSKFRFIARGLISTPIKKTPTKSITVGLVIVADPSSRLPVLPFISFYQKLKWTGSELFIDLPYRVVLRKELSPKSALSFGSTLEGGFFFLTANQPALNYDLTYSSLDFRTGFVYEYLVNKSIVIGLSSGIFTTASSRLREWKRNQKSDFIENRTGTTPYINLTISLLPFWKGFKK